jgi:hypothetical protein
LVLDGLGTAAIAADGRVGVVMRDGRCLVVGAPPVPERTPVHHAEMRLDPKPYAISAVAGGFVVLCGADVEEPGVPGGDWSTRLYSVTAPLRLRWSTHVVALDLDGQIRWRADVPFAVRQPAIEVGDDAVALAGSGLARIEAGRVTWTRPSSNPTFATAFVDGRLAVAEGRTIERITPAGGVEHRFDLGSGIEATSPPGIAPAGWIVQGTCEGVYALR